MDKQTTLAFILIGFILVVWLYINTPTTPPAKPKANDTTQVAYQKPDSAKKDSAPKADEKIETDFGEFFFRKTSNEKIITVETDFVLFEISAHGGKIVKAYLKNFNNWYVDKLSDDASIFAKKVQLLNAAAGGSFDISFVTSDGKAVATSELEFIPSLQKNKYKISGDEALEISFSAFSKNGGEIKRKYSFHGNRYDVDFDLELNGLSSVISNNLYEIVWNSGVRFVEENSYDEATYTYAGVYSGEEYTKFDASSDGEKIEKEFSGKIDWFTMRNKYFAAIMIPENKNNVEGIYLEGNRKSFSNGGVNESYAARMRMQYKGETNYSENFKVYIGPVSYDILKPLGSELQRIVDFGSFIGLEFLVRPVAEYVLLPLFVFLHSFIPNYGVVIIFFSLIIKFLLHPLTKSSYQSMKKMQLLQPKMAEVKEKFKDDPQKMNKETMKLYSTYGINPAGGCLPMLLQMPIFVALWGVFQTVIELRQQPFFWWITDLSKPDVIYSLGFKLPLFGISEISGLALLMGITTFLQQKMTMKDPQQKALVYIMPVMLTFLFMSFPSGLNLYYFLFNLFSIAQQYYINNKSNGMVLEPVKNPKKSGGFMQRMMEAAEKNAKQAKKKK